ncbi:YibE/F family protein [Bacillus sp. RD4P76]|uniref:YibE/F family protein n=2 Tax=Bacillus suaedaesalsae TaxID=2810349 RepID=A0ABS2DCR5_9BACI|nr:YibE/F family protein [Bacillus suaedaesalsae]MBM6616227.1 YibE/F family protein [Bacillus suaedaesalsae]
MFVKSLYKKMSYKNRMLVFLLLISFVGSIYFVHNNHFLYERPIAKVIKTNIEETTKVTDSNENEDQLYMQSIVAEVKNGKEKGKEIYLENEYSRSKAFDNEFHVGNELFIKIDQDIDEGAKLTGTILDVKRDKYLMMIAWVFIFVLLLVGKRQGLLSIISLIVNAIILSYALDIYLQNSDQSLIWICCISVILFTVISLLLVNGFNEKTFAAIIATLLGTFISLLITYIVLVLTDEKGLRYEELQFITRPYRVVFMAGLFIGSLGAVMDVAITMSSSLFSLYEKNNDISIKALIKSGMEIGRDIMGTMTNILFFAYVSGSIPILLLYFKNASPFGYTLSINLSLEMARALAGGIGIVLTIPIGLYITIFFINRKRAKL